MANLQYGSLYSIDLGQLTAGTTLTLTHDDGASLFQNGAPSVLNVAVPELVSIALVGSSLVGLGMVRRKRN